jgi:hypothetical protein
MNGNTVAKRGALGAMRCAVARKSQGQGASVRLYACGIEPARSTWSVLVRFESPVLSGRSIVMLKRTKAALCLAACAVFIGGSSTAFAADPVGQSQVTQPLLMEDAPPASQSVLNTAADSVGIGSMMKSWGIKAGGWVEGSYTYNTRAPHSDISEGRVFDFEHDAARLNQVALQFARAPDIAADAKAGKFDIGFGLDMMYGSDGRIIHSNGLSGYNNFSHPINQFDLTQAYVDFIIPVGNGLDIRAGKFVTLLGYETIAPIASVTGSTGNALYSHSFEFGFGIPFTETGVIGSYALSDKWTVTGGITRGWDQSTNDNNGAIDFLGQVKYTPNADWTFYINSTIGPERFKDNSDYRYVVEGIGQYAPKGSKWSFALDGIFGDEEHARVNGKTAYWYGVTGYAGYALCDYATINARGEWFRDDGGSRLGVDASLYEVTLGVKVTPFPHDKLLSNFTIRPEIRGDFSNKNVFDGGNKKDQYTAAVDAIFAL